jgi:hypothetical protein
VRTDGGENEKKRAENSRTTLDNALLATHILASGLPEQSDRTQDVGCCNTMPQ